MAFVDKHLNPLEDRLVYNNEHLTQALKCNGYRYSPQDDESEEWLVSDECKVAMEAIEPNELQVESRVKNLNLYTDHPFAHVLGGRLFRQNERNEGNESSQDS